MIAYRFFALFVVMSAISITTVWTANTTSPYEVVEQASKKLLDFLNRHQEELKTNPMKLRSVVESELMPFIDNTYSAYKILGPALKHTNRSQRALFVDEFSHHIASIYTDVLMQYEGQTYQIKKPPATSTEDFARVQVEISSTTTKAVNIEFLLRYNQKKQRWLIYDLITENISLLSTKQAEFAPILRDVKQGIDYLNQQLKSERLSHLSGKDNKKVQKNGSK